MIDDYTNVYDDYLMHHGVKGMKWGVRKSKPSIKKATSYNKKTNKNKKTKKTKKTKKVSEKIGPFLVSAGKVTMMNAARMGQNQHIMEAVDGLVEGNFSKASYNNWAAKKYENAIKFLSD